MQKSINGDKMKNVLKTIAPYITAILAAFGVYVENSTRNAVMEYKVNAVQQEQGGIKDDVKSIKELLYSIDTRLSIYSTLLDERTGKK